jgi:hypothetical protein
MVFQPDAEGYARSVWWSGGKRRRGSYDTFYDNVPANHADHNAQDTLISQEKPLIRGVVYAWQCGVRGSSPP